MSESEFVLRNVSVIDAERNQVVATIGVQGAPYFIDVSSDGKRAYVVTVFNVREKSGQKMPPGVMMSGTREAFLEAAQSVKARALGQNLKKP